MSGVDVSVLVPVLNEEHHLPAALAAMAAQRFDGEIELIFVDGGSTDTTRTIVEQASEADPRVRLLDNPASTTPHGLNIGLRHARGEYVARMDAHTRYPPDYLAVGVARLQAGNVDWVAGPQLAEGDGRWSRRVALALGSPLGTGGARFRRALEHETEMDTGFTGVWRRATLTAHDGWDEGWPVNQDTELAARIRKAGGRIVCVPEMAAAYIPRDSLRALRRQYWRYGIYRAKTSRRHPETLRRSNLMPPALVASLALSLVAPRPARVAARLPLVAYVALLTANSALVARHEPARDAASLPFVLATMHVAWGAGFLWGSLRSGPPARAVLRALGFGH